MTAIIQNTCPDKDQEPPISDLEFQKWSQRDIYIRYVYIGQHFGPSFDEFRPRVRHISTPVSTHLSPSFHKTRHPVSTHFSPRFDTFQSQIRYLLTPGSTHFWARFDTFRRTVRHIWAQFRHISAQVRHISTPCSTHFVPMFNTFRYQFGRM